MPHGNVWALFPDQVRRYDYNSILSGLGRFVAREGFWPTQRELASFLKADKGAVVYCLQTLTKQQLVQRGLKKSGYASYSLTARGWGHISMKPIEPWNLRPSRSIYRRAIREAAAKVLREEATFGEILSG